MNYRIVDGRLTKNAEVRVNKTNGKKFLSFTLANNGFARGEQVTTYFNVVSYNDYDINRSENFTQGKLVVVTGKPDEVLTIKDGKTYLNRNIAAYSIETGTPTGTKENATVTTYRDVAPAPSTNVATCDIPPVVAPSVSEPMAAKPLVQTYTQPMVQSQTPQGNTPDIDDDLPF